MTERYDEVLRTLIKLFIADARLLEDDENIITVIQEKGFHEYMMRIISENPEKNKTTMRVLSRILIRFGSTKDVEKKLSEYARQYDPLTYGLVRACGIGCDKDRSEAVSAISKSDVEVSEFYSSIVTSSYVNDWEVVDYMLDASRFIHRLDEETFQKSLHNHSIHHEKERIIMENLDLVMVSRYMDTKLNPTQAANLLESSLFNIEKNTEMTSLLYHLSRPFIYTLLKRMHHSNKDFVEEVSRLWEDIRRRTEQIRYSGSPLSFITSNRKGLPGLEYILSQSHQNSRMRDLLMITPYGIMTNFIGITIPMSIDPLYTDWPPANSDKITENELEKMQEDNIPWASYRQSQLCKDDPQERIYWLERSASQGYTTAQ